MHRKTVQLFLLLFALTALLAPASADEKDIALVLKTVGNVELGAEGRSQWLPAKRGARLNSGQIVRTGERSLAALVFTDDKTLLKVRANSNVKIKGERKNNTIVKRIQLAFGQIWAKVTRQNVSMRIESPSGVATVKGTIFNCLVADDNFYVFCEEGLMELVNQFGTMLLGANEMAKMTKSSGPERLTGDPGDIFDLSDDDVGKQLEFEFEDDDGNKKTIILDFE